jgi:hypothetical protein
MVDLPGGSAPPSSFPGVSTTAAGSDIIAAANAEMQATCAALSTQPSTGPPTQPTATTTRSGSRIDMRSCSASRSAHSATASNHIRLAVSSTAVISVRPPSFTLSSSRSIASTRSVCATRSDSHLIFDQSNVNRKVLPPRVLPTGTVVVATATSAVVSAVAGLVGVPVAQRPAVVGAAIRLPTCVVVDGDGPDVPPYDAMPVQFAVLDTPTGTAGLATATNAIFVVACMAAGYVAAAAVLARALDDTDGELTMQGALAHVSATVPLSYIAPALAESSAAWLTAAADGSVDGGLGPWWPCFIVGLGTGAGGCALLLWRARPTKTQSGNAGQLTLSPELNEQCDHAGAAQPEQDRQTFRDRRWSVLVGPLLQSTRDVTSPIVRYAFFVELGTSLLFSAFSGVRVESLCVAKCVAATLVAVGFLGYLVVVRPAAERADHWFGLGFAVMQVGTSVLVTAAVVGGQSTGPASRLLDTAQIINLATLALLVLQTVVALVVSCRRRFSDGLAPGEGSGVTEALAPRAVPLLTMPAATSTKPAQPMSQWHCARRAPPHSAIPPNRTEQRRRTHFRVHRKPLSLPNSLDTIHTHTFNPPSRC